MRFQLIGLRWMVCGSNWQAQPGEPAQLLWNQVARHCVFVHRSGLLVSLMLK